MRLSCARVLVTGASSGIGAELVRHCAERGARVLATGRNEAALAALTSETSEVETLPADLAEPGAVDELARWAGSVDVLAANAGVGYAGEFATMPPERIGELVALNLTASMALARAFAAPMRERGGGALLFVGSIAGAMGVPGEAVYAATKAGLAGFAESLRLELAPRVQVNVVLPGVVDTPFFARRGAPYRRGFPRPVPAAAVARAAVNAVERDRAEVFVPSWLRVPARLRGALPGPVRAARGRTG